MPSRVLLHTADPAEGRRLAELLAGSECEVVTAGSAASQTSPDLVVVDTRQGDTDAATLVGRLTADRAPQPPILIVADREAAEAAVAATLRGAADVVFRPLCPLGFPARVERLLARAEVQRAREASKTLEFRNQELESFIYIVTHDMKTPVVNLQGLVSLIEQDHGATLAEPVHDLLRRARRNADRLEELLRDLLEYPRRLRIVGPLETQPTLPIVNRAVDGVREIARGNGVEIVVAPDLPPVRCDAKRLQQVFHNLIENAVKHARGADRPRVDVRAARTSDGPRFEVHDNGAGIAPEHQRDIFKLFHRIPGSGDGTGIGLAVARQLVEAHGGEIWCESAPGRGTTFAFTVAP